MPLLAMRILIVDTCYAAFLRSHYGRHPGLEGRSYREQWQALMETFFGTADSYSHYLRELGHEATEIVVNCEPLQWTWVAEQPLRTRLRLQRGPRAEMRDRIVKAQVADFAPDVLYVQNLSALSRRTLERLGRSSLVVGQIASEPPAIEQLRAFNLILTSFPHFVDRFRQLGIASEHFRIGFDPRVLAQVNSSTRREGAVFVGTLARSQHSYGNAVLEQAARLAPIDFYGTGAETWPPDSPLRRRYRGEAWGLDMFRTLAGAKIVVNRHIDVAEDFANNMRLYEATGVGALLLTDEKRNLHEMFERDAEVATYRDERELSEKVAYFLAHEPERATIAAAGQRRTLREHTYAARMEELVAILADIVR